MALQRHTLPGCIEILDLCYQRPNKEGITKTGSMLLTSMLVTSGSSGGFHITCADVLVAGLGKTVTK
jgi:hypothetical protein